MTSVTRYFSDSNEGSLLWLARYDTDSQSVEVYRDGRWAEAGELWPDVVRGDLAEVSEADARRFLDEHLNASA